MCVNVWQLPVQVDQVTVLVGQVAVPLRVPVTVQVGVEVAVQVGGGVTGWYVGFSPSFDHECRLWNIFITPSIIFMAKAWNLALYSLYVLILSWCILETSCQHFTMFSKAGA